MEGGNFMTFDSLEDLMNFLNSSGLPLGNMTSDVTVAPTTDGYNNPNDSSSSSSGGRGTGGGVMYFPWANPQNIMTKEMSDDITGILQCYIFPIITLIGLTGNILSLAVLLQRKMRASTTSIVLIGLALSDIMFLITNAVRKSTCIIKLYDSMAADTLNATTFYYMFYLKTAFSRVSTLIVVLISVERLIAVALPLKIKTIVTKSRMLIAVIICYLITFAGLAGLPPQYTYTYVRGKPYISQTKFATKNADALKVYNEYFLPIAFRHLPVILVLGINTVIIILLGRSRRFQKNSTKQDNKRSDEQKKITRMLLSVAVVFLICLLPGDILLISSLTVEGFAFFGTYHNLFLALSDICLLFEMINSCANFVIYMLLNKNFFETFSTLFCCCIRFARSRDDSSALKSRDTAETSASVKVKGRGFDSSIVNEDPSVSAADGPEGKGEVNNAYID